jgi:hypothetical protein
MAIEIRIAEPRDTNAIAELHAASWRSAYRGMFADAYLDGDVVQERRQCWRKLATVLP